MRWEGHVAPMGEERTVYKVLVGKPEKKRPLSRLRHRWENGTKTDLGEIGWEGKKWNHLAQDSDRWRALVNTMMDLQILGHGVI
jgi:hypothetical protein